MCRLLRADTFRILHSHWLWIFLGGLLLMSSGLILMQYTAMDYTVPLSRVIFLPMSFYGVIVAALVSLYIGEDFSDGCIRNKLIVGIGRNAVYFSDMGISCLACAALFLITTLFSAVVGYWLFPHDAELAKIVHYIFLGMFMSLAYGCIFSVITLLCRNRTTSVVICMFLAFFMLFLCLHTNQALVQPEYKDGVLNPHYVGGAKRIIYGVLHDLNPTGQAAQLSAMECFHPVRFLICDILWGAVAVVGCAIFRKKDIK